MNKKLIVLILTVFLVIGVCIFIYSNSIQALNLPSTYQLEWDSPDEAMANYPWNDYRYTDLMSNGYTIKESCNVLSVTNLKYEKIDFDNSGLNPIFNISADNRAEYKISGDANCGFDLTNLFNLNKLPGRISGGGFVIVDKNSNGKWSVQGVGSGP